MTDEISVYRDALKVAEGLWNEQSQSTDQAADLLAELPLGGFDQEVHSELRAFLRTWGRLTKDIAVTSETLSTSLDAFRKNSDREEEDRVGEFKTVLPPGTGGSW